MDAVRIRRATPDDSAAIREVERRAGELFRSVGLGAIADDDPPDEAALAEFAAADRAWVATDARGAVIGYALVRVVDDRAHLEQVSVDPGWARRGIGAALIEQVAEWALARGLEAMTLTTFVDVPWNAPYYRRLGFVDLAPDALGPGLREIRAREREQGLDRWARTVMIREW